MPLSACEEVSDDNVKDIRRPTTTKDLSCLSLPKPPMPLAACEGTQSRSTCPVEEICGIEQTKIKTNSCVPEENESMSYQYSQHKDISTSTDFTDIPLNTNFSGKEKASGHKEFSRVFNAGRPPMCTSEDMAQKFTDLNPKELLDKSVGLQLQILKILQEVRHNVEINRKAIQNLELNNCVPSSTRCNGMTDMSFLPASCDQDIQNLECFLESNDNQQNLISYLSLTGGRLADDIIRRILQRIMTNTYATEYSFTGRKGKKSFNTLRVNKIIFVAVRNHRAASTVTDKELAVVIGNWLRYAPDRSKPKRKACGKMNEDGGE